MRYDTYPFGRAEQISQPAVIATYLASGVDCADILRRAGLFAVGQTVGTWVKVPGISQDMVEQYQGRVLAVWGAGDEDLGGCGRYVIRVAFPAANFGSSLTMLLTALVGNDVSTALRVRLLDIELTGGAAARFLGPQLGIEHLRRMTGVYGRPLLLNMIKPCAGFSPTEGARLFEQVARGGVDLIKDDELLASPEYNQVIERFRAYQAVAKAVAEENGKQPLYLPNITGTPSQMMDSAAALYEAGAQACLVNFVFSGLDTLRELTDRFGDQMFIMGHYAGVGVLDARDCGIADAVMLGILPRLAGAHTVMTMAPAEGDGAAWHRFRQIVQAQRLPMGGLAPLITAVGGGITPVSQAVWQRELGPETIIGIGGAIQGHPMGTTAGAEAAVCAVEATAQGIPLHEAAQACEALARALVLWGDEQKVDP